jgi:hypothetical protein
MSETLSESLRKRLLKKSSKPKKTSQRQKEQEVEEIPVQHNLPRVNVNRTDDKKGLADKITNILNNDEKRKKIPIDWLRAHLLDFENNSR